MPVQGQTGVALAFTKASLRPSLPATKYTAASPTSSPTRLSQRGWVIQGPLPYSGRAAPPEWHGRNASPPSSGHGVGGLLKEPPEHRIAGIALGQSAHVARGFLPQHGAAAGVARRLAHQEWPSTSRWRARYPSAVASQNSRVVPGGCAAARAIATPRSESIRCASYASSWSAAAHQM